MTDQMTQLKHGDLMHRRDAITAEYLAWKDLHDIQGKNHKIKRWSALLLLIIHYRVLRKDAYCFSSVKVWNNQLHSERNYQKLSRQIQNDCSEFSKSLKQFHSEIDMCKESNSLNSKELSDIKNLFEKIEKTTVLQSENLLKVTNTIESIEKKDIEREKSINSLEKTIQEQKTSLSSLLEKLEQKTSQKPEEKELILKVGIADIILSQQNAGLFCGYDLVARMEAIKERTEKGVTLSGTLYSQMQLNSCGINWDTRFENLIDNVNKEGLRPDTAITVNENMTIVDGAHRLALAAYKGIDIIPVHMVTREFQRPWSMSWFWEKGFSYEQCQSLNNGWKQLHDQIRYPFYITVFSPAAAFFDQITTDLMRYDPDNITVLSYVDKTYSEWGFRGLMEGMYYEDVISKVALDKKINDIKNASCAADNSYPVRIITVDVNEPCFTVRKENGYPQSMTLKNMKMALRGRYKERITNYKYDVIIHSSDNYVQTKMMKVLMEMDTNLESLFQKMHDIPYVAVKYEEAKQAKDFPKDFIIGSEIDIVTDLEKMPLMERIVEDYLAEKYNGAFSVSVNNRDKNTLIVLQYGNFNVFTVHLQTIEYFGLVPDYNSEVLNHRINHNGIYSLGKSYELLIRLAEVSMKPDKYWHVQYIKKYALDIDEELFDDAYPPDSEIRTKVMEYIRNLKCYNRYVKGDISK